MRNLKLINWNINQRSGFTKLNVIPELVVDEIEREKADIICLSEYVNQSNYLSFSRSLEKLGYKLFFEKNSSKNQILIGINTRSIDLDNVEVFSEEVFKRFRNTPDFLHLKITTHTAEVFNVIGVRIKIASPSKSLSYDEKIEFQINDAKERNEQLDLLLNYLDKVEGDQIIVGDFNNYYFDKDSNLSSWSHDQNYLQNYFSFPILLHKMLEKDFNNYTPEGYSWINTKLKSSPKRFIKNDHLFSNIPVSTVSYSWDFKENPDYIEGVVGYPDHAKLIANIWV